MTETVRRMHRLQRELMSGSGVAFACRVSAVGVAFLFDLVVARRLGPVGAGPFFLGLGIVHGLASDTVKTARELRRSYVQRWIRPSYLEVADAHGWEDKVRARLPLVQLNSRSRKATLRSGKLASRLSRVKGTNRKPCTTTISATRDIVTKPN